MLGGRGQRGKNWNCNSIINKLQDFICLFLEKGARERVGEKHQRVVASCVPPSGDLACNPGMCLDWESNQRPFGSQASTQSTEPHQPRQNKFFS